MDTMDYHFRAFSFVDRVTALEPGVSIRGQYTIPSTLSSFPASLVAESVGQLAAWASMSALDFSHRPVAGLAGVIELGTPAKPGDVLDLSVQLEAVDAEAVAYGGTAHVNGKQVIQLQHCVGPMLPLEEFDDPRQLRDRLALLRGAGAVPGAFPGVPQFALEPVSQEARKSLTARLAVPQSAPFFADHFPRRAVFPGTLLMHSNLELAASLARQISAAPSGNTWQLTSISDVKLRTFIPPGDIIEIEVRLQEQTDSLALITSQLRSQKRPVGGAKVLFLAV